MLRTLFLFIAMAMSTQSASADEVLIRGALLLDGSGAPPRPNVDVLIRDGRIKAIEPTGSIELRGTVIEAAGMTALPGLIDAHVHFVAAPGSGYRNDNDEKIAELNRRHLRAYLACGVTTVLGSGCRRTSSGRVVAGAGSGADSARFYGYILKSALVPEHDAGRDTRRPSRGRQSFNIMYRYRR